MQCQCSDPGCTFHKGRSCSVHASDPVRLWRIDMEDHTGTLFCSACAEDAMDAGVFTSEDPELAREEE